VPTVSKLSIAPVKALALNHPASIRLTPTGAEGNRRFYLADADGARVSGTKHGRLMQVRASYEPGRERLTLRFPDGREIAAAADRVDGAPVASDFWGRTVTGREVVGPFSSALTDWYGSTLRLIRTDRPGDATDVLPVSLMSTASAEALARRTGSDRPLETRRFRLLIELGDADPFQEDTWIGSPVLVGDAVIRIPGPIPRCAVTTYDPDTGTRDFGTLAAIKDTRGQGPGGELFFGVYGEVVESGTVSVGDLAEPLSG
jgi:uncharacterized protein